MQVEHYRQGTGFELVNVVYIPGCDQSVWTDNEAFGIRLIVDQYLTMLIAGNCKLRIAEVSGYIHLCYEWMNIE